MNMGKFFKQLVLTLALFASAGLALAAEEEEELCAPFMEGQVDASLLATMLSAADNGHLYRIQQESSRVGFCVNSKLSRVEGNFNAFTGGIALGTGKNSSGQTMVLIQAASLDTEGAFIKSMIKSSNFFDVENYPEVLFISNGFQWTGPDTAVLKGDLTLRGITKPVIFNVTLTALDDRPVSQSEKILVKATTTIDRAEFGMDKLESVVDSDVQLCLSVEAEKYETIGSRDSATSTALADHMIGPVPGLLDRTAG
jgi:polyisoprenoid-binding protein YceI